VSPTRSSNVQRSSSNIFRHLRWQVSMSQDSISSYLSAQPPELLDHICSYVDSPEDLLSLSLTSKQFCSPVIPNHIEFRRIRCDIRRLSVWTRLAESPTLAAKFTSLEIGLEKDPLDKRTTFPRAILPKSWIGSHTDGDSELGFNWPNGEDNVGGVGVAAATSWFASLVTVIRRMSSLTRFRWAVKFLPPSHDVVSALKNSCVGLVDIQIAYTGIGTVEPWSYFAIPSSRTLHWPTDPHGHCGNPWIPWSLHGATEESRRSGCGVREWSRSGCGVGEECRRTL
jgi:hypothetical protein